MDAPLTLVLLAAGLGSRFGGPKQLAPVGVRGEPVFAVTAAQARRAGFERLVLVTRGEVEEELAEAARAHVPDLEVALVRQDLAGPVRSRPWGTGHAVAVCAGVVEGPFAVANGDDLYGDPSLALLAGALGGSDDRDAFVVGFEVGRVLSPHGGVSRGVCRRGPGDLLVGVDERHGMVADRGVEGGAVDDTGEHHPPGTLISMGLWGMPGWVPAELAARFPAFVEASADRPDAEFQLPGLLTNLVDEGRLRLRVVPTPGPWLGLTHAGDLPAVREALADGSFTS